MMVVSARSLMVSMLWRKPKMASVTAVAARVNSPAVISSVANG